MPPLDVEVAQEDDNSVDLQMELVVGDPGRAQRVEIFRGEEGPSLVVDGVVHAPKRVQFAGQSPHQFEVGFIDDFVVSRQQHPGLQVVAVADVVFEVAKNFLHDVGPSTPRHGRWNLDDAFASDGDLVECGQFALAKIEEPLLVPVELLQEAPVLAVLGRQPAHPHVFGQAQHGHIVVPQR